MSPAHAPSARRPRHLGRHPAVIGVLESVRILLLLIGTAFALAAVAWFIGIAEQRPLAAIGTWAMSGLAAAAGLSVAAGQTVLGFPPGLLSLIIWLLVRSAARRTSIALEANTRLQRAGQLAAHRAPVLSGLLAIAATILLTLGALGFLIGTAVPTVLGILRLLVLVASAIVLGAGLHPHTAAEAVLTDRFGSAWEGALAAGHRICVRAGWALALLALALIGTGLVVRFAAVAEVVAGYSAPTAAAVGLGVVQLLFAPGALALALAWLSGAGIQLAADRTVSALSGVEAPRPALPLLALIPEQPAAWMMLGPVLLVVLGVLLVTLRRAWQDVSWQILTMATAEVVVLCAGWGLFATGPLGPGGLEVFGVHPLLFPALVGGLTAAGLWAGCGVIWAARRSQAGTGQ